MTVDVYRNLRTGTWSVRERGLVVSHPLRIVLEDVKFVVSPAGRQRVLQERRKNVHAFVRGAPRADEPPGEWRMAYYNPYEVSTFVDLESRAPLDQAHVALLDSDMRVYYQ